VLIDVAVRKVRFKSFPPFEGWKAKKARAVFSNDRGDHAFMPKATAVSTPA
jgi:hypothetical protein